MVPTELYRRALECFPEVLVLYDTELRYRFVNRRGVELSGLADEQALLGKTDGELFSPEVIATYVGHLRDAFRTGRIQKTETRMQHAGWTRVQSISYHPLHDEARRVTHVMGLARDVTSERATEEALRESRMLLERIFAGLSDIVLVMDLETRHVLMCNDALQTVLGYRPQEVVGATPQLLHVDEAHYREFASRARAGLARQQTFDTVYQLRHKDGRILTTEHRISSIQDVNGQLAVSIIRDVTERLAYRDRLKALAKELTLAEERARRQLAGHLHDEVVQSLALARMTLAQLEPTPELARAQTHLTEAVESLRSTTVELYPPALQQLGLAQGLESLLEDWAEREGVKAEFTGGRVRPGEEAQLILYRGVREALANIAKHAEAGRVRLELGRRGPWVEILVEDNGVGFDPERSRRVSKQGGFGLFNLEERLTELGGELEVESRPGEGTRLWLRVLSEEGTHCPSESS